MAQLSTLQIVHTKLYAIDIMADFNTFLRSVDPAVERESAFMEKVRAAFAAADVRHFQSAIDGSRVALLLPQVLQEIDLVGFDVELIDRSHVPTGGRSS